MAGQLGGKRPGAGRPRTREKHGGEIAAAEQRIADFLPTLIDKAFELANGVRVEKKTRSGSVVYKQPPCIKSIMYLVDRLAGKPTQALEHSGPDGEEIRHAVAIYLPHNGRNPINDRDPTAGGTAGDVA